MRAPVLDYSNTNASHNSVTFDYLSVPISELSLTYVTDSVEESLLRWAHIKFALCSWVDEGCTENLSDHGNETKAAPDSQQPMELAMPCLT